MYENKISEPVVGLHKARSKNGFRGCFWSSLSWFNWWVSFFSSVVVSVSPHVCFILDIILIPVVLS